MWRHYIHLVREQKVVVLSSWQAIIAYIVEVFSVISLPIILQQ